MTALLQPAPLSPRTPTDVFAALALSPGLATPQPSAVPTLHLCPPSPSPMPCTTPRPPPVVYRPLSLPEARQLTALLHSRFSPVRFAPRQLMSESIRLAEELHMAGIRWDKVRRVMGMHLRGIWEEGEKVGGQGGMRAMERYIQGSFLSVAEDPHPLDSQPIPIEIARTAQASLPKLTLQAGLVQALGAAAAPAAVWAQPSEEALRQVNKSGVVGRQRQVFKGKSIRLKRGKQELRIHTGLPLNPRTFMLHIPHTSSPTLTSTRAMLGRGGLTAKLCRQAVQGIETNKQLKTLLGIKARPGQSRRSAMTPASPRVLKVYDRVTVESTGLRTARRVSVGGWEVR